MEAEQKESLFSFTDNLGISEETNILNHLLKIKLFHSSHHHQFDEECVKEKIDGKKEASEMNVEDEKLEI